MSQKKTILLFIDNKREEVNLKSYFKATECHLKVARELFDFRHFIKTNYASFIIVDSSVKTYGPEIVKILNSNNIPYCYLAENISDKFLQNSIQKPYLFSSIVNYIEEKIGIIDFDKDKGEIFFTDEQYTAIKVDEVINLKVAPFDYFVKINDSKYVRIAKSGMNVSTQILTNIQNKGVNLIFSKKDDYKLYLDKMTASSLNIKKMKIPKEVKMKFLAKTSDLIMDQIISEGISKEMFYSSKQVLDSSMELVMEDDNIYSLLKTLNDLDENAYRHSLAMAIYSILIAKELSWETETTIFKISLGALFADVGLKTLPPKIIEKSRDWIDGQELEMYKSHPLISYNILKENKEIHQDILDIVAQHHEYCDGTGYPKQLTKDNIHPLARLVGLADEFCEQALKTEKNESPPTPKEIILRLLVSSNKKFDYNYLLALAKVFKIDTSIITSIAS